MAIVSPSTKRSESNGGVLLRNIPWATYEAMVEDPANRHVRMTYDRGSLELMSPLSPHETLLVYFRRMIEALAFELGIPIKGLGATTLKREDVERGLEPDASFYFANERRIRGKKRLDLTIDPPPDLAIEIDITSSSLNRQSIYASLGVPEIWRFDGESLRVGFAQESRLAQEQKTLHKKSGGLRRQGSNKEGNRYVLVVLKSSN